MDTEMKTNVPLTAAVVIGLMDPAQSWAWSPILRCSRHRWWWN